MGQQPQERIDEAVIAKGRRLAESPRWRDYFTPQDGQPVLDDLNKALTAYLLEREYEFLEGLSEDTRIANIGSFEKYVFPIIRAVFPNLVATELVSVQPMQGPVSLVFFMDFKAGSKKGSVNVGDVLISSRTGQAASTNYSGEQVLNETVSAGSGGATATPQLAYFPVRPLSVVITVGTQTYTDDGNGAISDGASGGGTITYSTGAISMTGIGAGNQASAIVVNYDYASEGSLQVPQIDVSVTGIPVNARPRKLRARWSVEAAAQMRAVHGTDTETEVTTAMAEEIRFDIDREIISDLRTLAAAPGGAQGVTGADYWFYKTPPTGVSWFEHKMTFVDSLIAQSQYIFQQTKRAVGNWVVMGTDSASIVESLPMFKATQIDGAGVIYMGDLQGRWRIYKDPYFGLDAGSTTLDYLVGHRGTSYLNTGYIYAPWIPLYTTPTVYLDDFIGRKGLLTEYAKKPVNALFYTRGKVVNSAHP